MISDKGLHQQGDPIDDNLATYARKDDSTHEEGELPIDTSPKQSL